MNQKGVNKTRDLPAFHTDPDPIFLVFGSVSVFALVELCLTLLDVLMPTINTFEILCNSLVPTPFARVLALALGIQHHLFQGPGVGLM